MTRNEYIASIMLEAADLLREDSSDRYVITNYSINGIKIKIYKNYMKDDTLDKLKVDYKILKSNWNKIYKVSMDYLLSLVDEWYADEIDRGINVDQKYLEKYMKDSTIEYCSYDDHSYFEIWYNSKAPYPREFFGGHSLEVDVKIKDNKIIKINPGLVG